jgi:cold shock CspA family protein
VQGVVEAFDPATGSGIVLSEADGSRIVLRPASLEGSIFRTLRQGQRINFDVTEEAGTRYASSVRVGSDGR